MERIHRLLKGGWIFSVNRIIKICNLITIRNEVLSMTLVAIDMDGTLLTSDGTISEENIKAIQEVQQLGHQITICSGRSHPDIQQILQKYGIEASIISGNGAMVYHGDFVIQLFLSDKMITDLLAILKNNNVFVEIYTEQGIIMEENSSLFLYEEIERLAKSNLIDEKASKQRADIILNQNSIIRVPDIHALDFSKMRIYKMNGVTFDPNKRSLLMDLINRRDDISVTTGGPATIEFGHGKTNKGYGLQCLAEHLQIPLEETLVIGDNFNDIPMFKVAGQSIAMANSEKEVKQLATYMTDDHNRHGVAKALRKYVIEKGILDVERESKS